MKPLVVMVTFNRLRETRATMEGLAATTDLDEVELVIVDNGSSDGTASYVLQWYLERRRRGQGHGIVVRLLTENVGCPRALNLALRDYRWTGQAVVKVDNDVRMLTPGWVQKAGGLVEGLEEQGRRVAMVGAYYDGVLDGRMSTVSKRTGQEEWEGERLYRVWPIIGHTVWHTGAFMDAVGYFDVLAEDHLYGFEDLILSHKACVMGWETLVWEGWRIENLQRRSSLGDKQREHVERMRPVYNKRVRALRARGSVWTGADGGPGGRGD